MKGWRSSRNTSVARWLGVFPRRVKLDPENPRVRSLIPPAEPALIGKSLMLSGRFFAETHSVFLENLLNDWEFAKQQKWTSREESAGDSPNCVSREPEYLLFLKRLAAALRPPLPALLSPAGPIPWPGNLFPFQIAGIQALIACPSLLLADDMGLGKTIQAVAALRILMLQGEAEQALVVVPVSLLEQWKKELEKWAPELKARVIRGFPEERAWKWKIPAHVTLISYETLRSDWSRDPHAPVGHLWDVVILDEAHKIKSRESAVSQACKGIQRKRAWGLTGTPLENHVDELASVLEFVTSWQREESPVILRPGPELSAVQKNVQLRRRKQEVLTELPPKLVSEIFLSLSPRQRESYLRAETEGVLRLREEKEVRIENVLELIVRLKQICNFCPDTGESAKLTDIRERLETLTAEGHRALIFSQFTDSKFGVRAIAEKLKEYSPLYYTGDLSVKQKEEVLFQFRENPAHKVLVLSLRAGAVGLNLQEASYVIHMDRWWNPAIENQADDRSHRMGQSLPVTVYKYTCQETIEERIAEVLRSKQVLFNQVVDEVSVDLSGALTGSEIYRLFGLSPPRKKESEPAVPDFNKMSGKAFEAFTSDLIKRSGWLVESTSGSHDGGVDLIARRMDEIGVEELLYVQCKNQEAPVGVDTIRQLYGVMASVSSAIRGMVAAPSGFTAEAKFFASKVKIGLWDKKNLVRTPYQETM